jgi:hypothetical protein
MDNFTFNFYQLLLVAKIGLYTFSLKGFFVKTTDALDKSYISTDFILNTFFMVYIYSKCSRAVARAIKCWFIRAKTIIQLRVDPYETNRGRSGTETISFSSSVGFSPNNNHSNIDPYLFISDP